MADWFDRKKIMFTANIFRAFVLFIFLIFSGWEYAVLAYSVIFITSAAKLVFVPSEASSIPDVVAGKNILRANTIFNLTNQVTYLVGFIAAGPLLNLLGPRVLFSVLICFFLAAAVASSMIRIPKRESKIDGDLSRFFSLVKDFVHSFLEGFRYILKNKVQKVALVHTLMSQAMFYIFIALIFKLGEYLIGLTPSSIGIVSLAPLGIGILLGMFLLNTKYRNKKRIKLSLFGVGLEMVAFGMITFISILIHYDISLLQVDLSYIVSVIMLFALTLIGFGFPFLFIPSQTLIQEYTDKGFLGRVYGVWFALSQAIASIPAVIIGFLADQYLAVPVTLGLYTLIAGVYLSIMWRFRNLG